MKYRVNISYHKFMFDDPVEAVVFAERAKQHYVGTEDRGITVSVEILNDDEKEGEE